MSDADRQRRRRELERDGKRVYGLALRADLVDHALVAAGLAGPNDDFSREIATELLTALVAEHLFCVTRDCRRADGLDNDRRELIRRLQDGGK